MKFGVVVFPGSNCDQDCVDVAGQVFAQPVQKIWHKETSLKGVDIVIIPGGFSYGDYLRCGAIAKFSPIMKEIATFASKGGKVLGICNGFQILIESGLLPGVLMQNFGLKFICDSVYLKLKTSSNPFTSKGIPGSLYQMPIAHKEGNYFIDPEGLKRLQDQIVFQYCDALGQVTEESNPNGSILSIAGITNKEKNVLGMMPHPERRCEPILGGVDGRLIFESLISSF